MGMLSYAPVALPVMLVGWIVIYLAAPRLLRGRATSEEAVREWRVEIPVEGRASSQGRRRAAWASPGPRSTSWSRSSTRARCRARGDHRGGRRPRVHGHRDGGPGALGEPVLRHAPDRLYAVTIRSGSGTEVRSSRRGPHVVAARSATPLREPACHQGTVLRLGAEVGAVRAHAPVGLWQDAASRVPQPRGPGSRGHPRGRHPDRVRRGVPIELAAVAGAVLMVLTGVLRAGQAARAIDLNIMGILAGSIGLGVIVVTSGLADVLADVVRRSPRARRSWWSWCSPWRPP